MGFGRTFHRISCRSTIASHVFWVEMNGMYMGRSNGDMDYKVFG